MSTAKELGEVCQAEIKQLKTDIQLKETHILKRQETIRCLKRNTRLLRRQQAEKKKRAAESKFPEKTLIYDNMVGKLDILCATCQRYLKTL